MENERLIIKHLSEQFTKWRENNNDIEEIEFINNSLNYFSNLKNNCENFKIEGYNQDEFFRLENVSIYEMVKYLDMYYISGVEQYKNGMFHNNRIYVKVPAFLLSVLVNDENKKIFVNQLEYENKILLLDEFVKIINLLKVDYLRGINVNLFLSKYKFKDEEEFNINSSPTKINSRITNLQAIGYLFTELIDKGLIEPRKRGGKPSATNVARMILEHFHFEDLEWQPTEEDLRKTLFTDNKLSQDKQQRFVFPYVDKLNLK